MLRLAVVAWCARVAVRLNGIVTVDIVERHIVNLRVRMSESRRSGIIYDVVLDGFLVRVRHHVDRRRVVGHGSNVEPGGLGGRFLREMFI